MKTEIGTSLTPYDARFVPYPKAGLVRLDTRRAAGTFER